MSPPIFYAIESIFSCVIYFQPTNLIVKVSAGLDIRDSVGGLLG